MKHRQIHKTNLKECGRSKLMKTPWTQKIELNASHMAVNVLNPSACKKRVNKKKS